MATKKVSDKLVDILTESPTLYLDALLANLAESRKMVWGIIETKSFVGFDDAEKLIKAYDHLDKVLSIFESYQLPLPTKAKGEKAAKTEIQHEFSVEVT